MVYPAIISRLKELTVYEDFADKVQLDMVVEEFLLQYVESEEQNRART